MVGLGLNMEESMGSQRQDHFVNLECRRDCDGNVHTTHTSRRRHVHTTIPGRRCTGLSKNSMTTSKVRRRWGKWRRISTVGSTIKNSSLISSTSHTNNGKKTPTISIIRTMRPWNRRLLQRNWQTRSFLGCIQGLG